ncbi:MAG: hypothetical protein IJA80_04985 [Clostridia bacterium]|nr:hypothetical protein [Clostridia bacterium]
MEEKQKDNKINSKTESLLKLVSGLLIISCAITVALLFKINEINDNLNRLSYIIDNETESYQYKDTIDVFYEETENGEEMLPGNEELNSNKNEDVTDNKQIETTSKKDNSIATTENNTNKNEETQSADNSTKRDYVININSNKIHYSSCTFVGRMKEENKKEIKLSKNELNNYLNNGYTFCSTCGG